MIEVHLQTGEVKNLTADTVDTTSDWLIFWRKYGENEEKRGLVLAVPIAHVLYVQDVLIPPEQVL